MTLAKPASPAPRKRLPATAAALLLGAAGALGAAVKTYDFTYSGPALYDLAGSFSFEGLTAGPTVEEGELLSFGFSVTLKSDGSTVGSFALPPDPQFNFNFDAVNEAFLLGGLSFGDQGQQWNAGDGLVCPGGVGFAAGNALAGFCIDNVFTDFRLIAGASAFFTVTDVSVVAQPVPEPETYALMLAGLAGLAAWHRRRARAA